VVGLFFVGMFIAVVCAYGCTEYLLAQLDARRRVLTGEGHSLRLILTVNGASLLILCLGSIALVVASGIGFYLQAVVICVAAQALWLTQHLWAYYRDHLRLRF
jgi:hypothetical protein